MHSESQKTTEDAWVALVRLHLFPPHLLVVFLVLHLSFDFQAEFMPPTELKGQKERIEKKIIKQNKTAHSIGICYQDERRKK